MAIALVATMVFGSCITAYAEAPATSGGENGAGRPEGHLEKKVTNVVLPTVAQGTTPFNYTMDPERLINATNGDKYAQGTVFPEEASDTGVYFLTDTNKYANESKALTVTNKSSCDIALSVNVKATATAGGTDIALAESSTVATTGNPNLYLGLKVGDQTKVVSATEQTVTTTLAGIPGNFETKVVNDAYKYQEVENATGWKTIDISLEGAVSKLPITTTTTAPTVNVTWSWTDPSASAAPSIAVTSYDMVADTPVTVSYSLGLGDAAAEAIESVIWTNAYPDANLYGSAEYVTKNLEAKTFTLTAASINNMIARDGDSQTIKVTFDDGTSINLTFNDPE